MLSRLKGTHRLQTAVAARTTLDSGNVASTDELWQEMEAADKAFAPFRDSALDRWHRKTMLATGKSAMKSQLKALNQSLSQQVAVMMRDPTRAISRTRPPLATRPKPLCEATTSASATTEGEEIVGASDTPSAGLTTATDANVYDDSEFYQLLLKEFLEAANVDSDAARLAMSSSKTRKIVDRRASKGRKIRYHVIDKLVNFMAPTLSQNNEMIQNMFSNLFGHQTAVA